MLQISGMRLFLFCILMALSTTIVFSQNKSNVDSSHVLRKRIIKGDTLFISEIPEVKIFPGYFYKSWWDNRRYQRLVKNVKAAYPYAKIAGPLLKDLDQRIASINNERQREAYIKYTEDRLRGEFEGAIRGLTVTQGKILIKLIDRETGNTTYTILKEFKGNFSAGFWQTIARIFGNNLKSEYDPFGDDAMIEVIINMIDSGQI